MLYVTLFHAICMYLIENSVVPLAAALRHPLKVLACLLWDYHLSMVLCYDAIYQTLAPGRLMVLL